MGKSKIRKIASPLVLKALRTSPFIRHKLQYFLTVNELYIKADVKTSQDKDKQRHTKIADSLLIKYKTFRDEYDDKVLELELMKTAHSKIDRSLLDYEGPLGSLFNSPVLKVENLQNRVLYRLRLKESKTGFYHVISDNREQLRKGSIKLSKYDIWNYKDIPHSSLSGPSGSGKSRLLYYIINQAMQETKDENIFIVDPKRDELAVYCRELMRLHRISTEKDDIIKTMRLLVNTMKDRYRQKEFAGLENGKMLEFQPIFIFFDELAAFQATLNAKNTKDKISEKEEFLNMLRSLILEGRAANIHIMLISQQLNANAVPTEIRDSLGLKIALGEISPENYRMNFGESRDKSQILTNTSLGSGFIKNGTKPVQPFQAFSIYTPYEATTQS